MLFLLLLLLIATAFITAFFLNPVAVSFLLDTDQMDMLATASWKPLVRAEARIINYRLFVTVYLRRIRIYAGFIKPQKKGRSGKAFFESMDLSNTAVRISCGLHEPHLTGLFSGAADFATALVRTADIELEPVFTPCNEFLRIDAKTELNAGKTLFNMLRKKFAQIRRRNNYGSTQFN
ncbi:MAG: hypothetical protein GX847_09010 [Clostridiales bacterium]|nr:hypothetical protein [Clostridiales bacterium]